MTKSSKSLYFSYIFSLIINIFLINSYSANAQLPADLKNFKTESLTDDEVLGYIAESEKSGLSEAELEKIAAKRGMDPIEAQKLKVRVNQLKNKPSTAKVVSEKQTVEAGNLNAINEPVKLATPIIDNPVPAPSVQTNDPTNPPGNNEIYGHHLFKNNNLLFFEKAGEIKAPDGYIIGSNDELTISVFGYSYFNEVLKIDARGAINPSIVGPIMLKGMEFGNAKKLIRTKFGQSFDLSNNQLSITLSYSRVITVNFVGEVNKPGSYKIPALNTAFNAMIAVGGPSKLGSVRNIQVRRNGKTVKILDVYEYLNNPNSKMDYYLEDNDYLFVMSSEKIVKISGMVKRPMFYELKAKENLDDLIRLAGGLNSTAYTKLIRVIRIGDDGTQQQILDLSLDSLKTNKKIFALKDGDQIEIGEKLNELRQFLEITGPVYMPGRYQFKQGDKITDLIHRANGLKKEAKMDMAFLIRTNADKTRSYLSVNLEKLLADSNNPNLNLPLKEGDVLRISSTAAFIDAKSVSVTGLFRKPGNFDYFDGIRITDVIFLADGVREEANLERAFLVRINPDFTKGFIALNLKEAMLNPEDTLKNLYLKRGDIITLASIPEFIDKMNVNAVGLFRKPGNFEYANGMTLSDLIILAGGLKIEADLLNIEVSRISFFASDFKPGEASRVIIKTMQVGKDLKLTQDQMEFKLNPFDQVFVRMVPDFELPKNLTITGEVKYPGVYALSSKEEHIDEFIKRAGGLNRFGYAEGATLYRPNLPGGYVVMNLREALKNHKSKFNYILKEGDVVNIPLTMDLIAIKGDVEYLNLVNQEQVNAPFVSGKRANYYVKEYANGFSKTSFKRKTYVVESNAKVNRTKNFVLFKVFPKVRKGASIYVVSEPEKKKKEKAERPPTDWNKAIEGITIKITGLLTLMILIQTLEK